MQRYKMLKHKAKCLLVLISTLVMEEKEICINIGKRIRQLLEEEGISQQELALRCGFEDK